MDTPDPRWFPAWKYHVTLPAVIVQTPAEAEALGPDWYDHPDQCPAPVAYVPLEPPVKPKPRTKRRAPES